jgi:Helix-turn-helix domain of resolvase
MRNSQDLWIGAASHPRDPYRSAYVPCRHSVLSSGAAKLNTFRTPATSPVGRASTRETSRANGTKFGRPKKVDDAEHIATAKRMKSDGHTGKDIAKYLGVSRATLYRYLDDDAA